MKRIRDGKAVGPGYGIGSTSHKQASGVFVKNVQHDNTGKFRKARLRWFGHVQRRDSGYIGRRILKMELPGRRQRGRK